MDTRKRMLPAWIRDDYTIENKEKARKRTKLWDRCTQIPKRIRSAATGTVNEDEHKMDDMILSIHMTLSQSDEESSAQALSRLKSYTLIVPPQSLLQSLHSPLASVPLPLTSPLIRLLSFVNGDSCLTTTLIESFGRCSRPFKCSETSWKMDFICKVIKTLCTWDPTLIRQASPLTNCLPLHLALQNYTTNDQVIRLLMDLDTKSTQERSSSMNEKSQTASVWGHCNRFGEIPLHVACSKINRLSSAIFKYILKYTYNYSSFLNGERNIRLDTEPTLLVWSKTRAGHTPLDLIWKQHVESLHGGMGTTGQQQLKLLEQCFSTEMTDNLELRNKTVKWVFHYICMIAPFAVNESLTNGSLQLSPDVTYEDTGSGPSILHLVSALTGPADPTLPLPIAKYVFHQANKTRVAMMQDKQGRTPLHYCFLTLTTSTQSDRLRASRRTATEWHRWINKLIQMEPRWVFVADEEGRLPLHYVLANDFPACNHFAYERRKASVWSAPVQIAVVLVIEKLLQSNPQSIEVMDPKQRLYPFAMTAANPYHSLSTTFSVLKQCPTALSLSLNQ